MVLPVAGWGQSSRKGVKEVSPFVEGRQKVRRSDYDSVWKFTSFEGKKKYYCQFDYATMPTLTESRRPEWGNFSPVMNYLTTVTRSPLRICAIFALNPSVTDEEQRTALIESARSEALAAQKALTSWMTEREMRNKVQIQVAQVDYRYWMGNDYFSSEQPQEEIIRLGYILYFGTKKVNLFPSAAEGAKSFNNIKFFPNDATVQESYDALLDDLAAYLSENDRLEVLLRGYSDNIGTDAYCKGLSRQRAVEVKKKLIARGIPSYRIEIEANGSADPLGDNSTYEGRIANNRVAIVLQ